MDEVICMSSMGRGSSFRGSHVRRNQVPTYEINETLRLWSSKASLVASPLRPGVMPHLTRNSSRQADTSTMEQPLRSRQSQTGLYPELQALLHIFLARHSPYMALARFPPTVRRHND